MQYMEVPRPTGNGLCSDDSCPCGYPGATIPRGEGYLYISKEVADFRKDCPSVAAAQAKIAKMQARMGGMIVAGSGVFSPILMCEQGARARGINLEVAAADARHWWSTGQAPLRATPMAGQSADDGGASPKKAGCAVLLAAVLALGGALAGILVMACYG